MLVHNKQFIIQYARYEHKSIHYRVHNSPPLDPILRQSTPATLSHTAFLMPL